MNSGKGNLRFFFFMVCLIGLILVGAELAFQLFNASICTTEGCQVAIRQTRYGSISILLPGIAIFLVLALLTKNDTSQHKEYFDKAVSILLIAALSAEGFLVGYQAFRIQAVCAFCIVVFGIFIVLALLWFLEGHREVVSGLAGFFAVFIFLYLIMPVSQAHFSTENIGNSMLTLFYNTSCRSCENIDELCKECDIQVNKIEASKNVEFLNFMDIKQLPVLVVNRSEEKKIIIGESRIKEYLMNSMEDEGANPER
ncbi:MAG: hypothetical protein JXC33_12400 [Deltaproteobacteria bacterium]|nr:hypothetical protein [Deltaproteobacteria bacterium]